MYYLIFMSQLRSCNGFKYVYNVKISSSLNFEHAGQNIRAQDVKLHVFACLTLNKNQCLHSRAKKKKTKKKHCCAGPSPRNFKEKKTA